LIGVPWNSKPSTSLASGSLAMVSWYLIERACFSEISALSRSPAKRCGSCRRLSAVARISSHGSGFASPKTGSGVLHPEQPELAHQIEDFGSLHDHALLS
jgi:hypothetical protein